MLTACHTGMLRASVERSWTFFVIQRHFKSSLCCEEFKVFIPHPPNHTDPCLVNDTTPMPRGVTSRNASKHQMSTVKTLRHVRGNTWDSSSLFTEDEVHCHQELIKSPVRAAKCTISLSILGCVGREINSSVPCYNFLQFDTRCPSVYQKTE